MGGALPLAAPAPEAACRLRLRGVVQGVGMRPFVLREARALGLAGRVLNDGAGVLIEAEGDAAVLACFAERIVAAAPPQARIDSVARAPLAPRGFDGFVIACSADSGRGTLPSPDLVVCEACRAEIADPAARRYRYPFTSCTRCGPRYSITRTLPFDRANTAMDAFPPCAACQAEYVDPDDRRCHAQTLACPACGPRLLLGDAAGHVQAEATAALDGAIGALADGRIVAVKGLGGFQLVVRADRSAAVARLRTRKARGGKPFAVMVSDLGAAAREVSLQAGARDLLTGPGGPIVILPRAGGGGAVAACAPGCPDLGVMLPTTPLHQLLVDGVGAPLVVTSGNRAGEPLCRDGTEARARLAAIADLFLDHDRIIEQPLDDSVVRIDGARTLMLRRARGYAPLPLELPGDSRAAGVPAAILACGAQAKSVVAITAGSRVWLGPYLGDLDDTLAEGRYVAGIAALERLAGVMPRVVAHDVHGDYTSTRHALTRPGRHVAVQHHHAHIAACMAEHGLDGRVLGIAWDGSGDGGDGTVWGGECLDAGYADASRVATLTPFRLAGGEAAVREPRRVALALLAACERDDAAAMLGFAPHTQANLLRMMARGLHAPSTTSMGRLFDGVSALLGLCHVAHYEGEAAMRLEWTARRARPPREGYPLPLDVSVTPWRLDWRELIAAVLSERAAGVALEDIAARFHLALAAGTVAVATRIGHATVCLSGGCFQNVLLARLTRERLEQAGFRVYTHEAVPPNDGGLALGQAAIAARRVRS